MQTNYQCWQQLVKKKMLWRWRARRSSASRGGSLRVTCSNTCPPFVSVDARTHTRVPVCVVCYCVDVPYDGTPVALSRAGTERKKDGQFVNEIKRNKKEVNRRKKGRKKRWMNEKRKERGKVKGKKWWRGENKREKKRKMKKKNRKKGGEWNQRMKIKERKWTRNERKWIKI